MLAVVSLAPLFTEAEGVQLRSAALPANEQVVLSVSVPKLIVFACAVPAKSVTPSARASFRIRMSPSPGSRLELPSPEPADPAPLLPKRDEAAFRAEGRPQPRVRRPGAPSRPVGKARPAPSRARSESALGARYVVENETTSRFRETDCGSLLAPAAYRTEGHFYRLGKPFPSPAVLGTARADRGYPAGERATETSCRRISPPPRRSASSSQPSTSRRSRTVSSTTTTR